MLMDNGLGPIVNKSSKKQQKYMMDCSAYFEHLFWYTHQTWADTEYIIP